MKVYLSISGIANPDEQRNLIALLKKSFSDIKINKWEGGKAYSPEPILKNNLCIGIAPANTEIDENAVLVGRGVYDETHYAKEHNIQTYLFRNGGLFDILKWEAYERKKVYADKWGWLVCEAEPVSLKSLKPSKEDIFQDKIIDDSPIEDIFNNS